MPSELDLYKQISSRERNSRLAAEQLLEQKSLELYNQNVELKQQTAALSGVNSILSTIMLAAPDSVITCDKEGLVTGMNMTAEKCLSISEKKSLGQPIDRFAEIQFVLDRFPEPSEIYLEEVMVTGADGTSFPAEIRGSKGEKSDSRCYYVLFIHDITRRLNNTREREKLTRRINEARRLEAIGTLSAGIAHEINTPLQFIGDNIQYVAEGLSKIHKSYGRYEKLRRTALNNGILTKEIEDIQTFNDTIKLDRLIVQIFEAMEDSVNGIFEVKDILNVMREFVHSGPKDFTSFDIRDLISNALKLCKNRTKNAIETELNFDADTPQAHGLRGPLQQVILNLIINAIDAVEEVGRSDPRIAIFTYAEEESLVVEIADNGPGIPDDHKEKIFDPFFTSKAIGKGTGQGLALAMDVIVNRHEGHLALAKRPGFNTVFKISIPTHPIPPTNGEPNVNPT